MVKNYKVCLTKRDNRFGNIENFIFEREKALKFSSFKECYIDASNVILNGLSLSIEWTKVCGTLLADYAEEKVRLPKIKELSHTSEYYTYFVTISCE